MSECCTGRCTGFLPTDPAKPKPSHIIENTPFSSSGRCCEIVCSGFTEVDVAKNYDIDYISLDDGLGGFVENIKGEQRTTYPCINPNCCSGAVQEMHDKYGLPNYPPADTTQWDWYSTGKSCKKISDCDDTYTGCEFLTYTCTSTSVKIHLTWPTWVWSSWTWTYEPSCTPTWGYTTCQCPRSGWIGAQCQPFEWDTGLCRFTGTLYNNDGSVSVEAGTAEVYFDDCANRWAIDTTWPSLAGETLYSTCEDCTGFCKCKQGGAEPDHKDLSSLWFGSYTGSSPASGTVCCVSHTCGAHLTGSKIYCSGSNLKRC